jgi:hypothetical protein
VNAENVEEVGRDLGATHRRRLCAANEKPSVVITREVAEDGVPRSPLEIVGKRRFRSLIDLTVKRLPQMDESIRLREWERAQQHGVDNAEDRRVCSDAEGER